MPNLYNQDHLLTLKKAPALIAARTYFPAIFAAFLLVPALRAQDAQPLPKASLQTQTPAPIVRPHAITLPQKFTSSATSAQTPAATPPKRVLPQAVTGAAPLATATPAQSPSSSTSAPVHHSSTALFSSAATTGRMIPAPPGPFNRTVIFLDAAHGGADSGGRINDSTTEKEVDLQFAFKLRSLLAARGFAVVLSREDDNATVADKPDTQLTLDARAGMGNHVRPVACLLIHSTGSGRGVHLYSSELTATNGELAAAPWLTAQAPWVSQSLKLQKLLGQTISRASIPLVLSRASVRPVDSLTCPALVIELAPKNSDSASINDSAYQQSVAQAIASALIFWQNSAQPPARLVAAPTTATPTSTPTAGAQP